VPIGAFLLRRLGLGLLSVLGVSLLVFGFLHMIPGDPVDHLAGGDAPPELRKATRECMHLDKPMHEQFGIFLGNVVDLSLGQQCPNPKGKPSVMDRIVEVFPYTIELAIAGMVVALLLALPLGVLAAVRQGSWFDTLATVISLSGIAFPVMLMGPLALFLFFIQLGWLPGPHEPDARFALVLPAVVVGTHLMAMLARMTRSSMVEVLHEDFVRTARAKGLPERSVLFKHALRNALLPVITIAGLQFGAMLSGAIITEKVFSRPGLGTLLLDAIQERNYPIVQGTVLVIAAIYVVVNLLVDVAYGLADPRIRRG
jgi:ABC-type dipeptide/oligopeptide/nickel transport system permease component